MLIVLQLPLVFAWFRVYARKFYVRVAMLNRELVNQHTIRINARQELLDALKALNLSIEQFSRLRSIDFCFHLMNLKKL